MIFMAGCAGGVASIAVGATATVLSDARLGGSSGVNATGTGWEILTFGSRVSCIDVQSSQHCRRNGSMHNSRPACGPVTDKKSYKVVNLSAGVL